MTDTAREKLLALMTRIEEGEDRLAELEKQLASGTASANAADLRKEIAAVQEQLARDRVELARISDGCSRPHPESRAKKS